MSQEQFGDMTLDVLFGTLTPAYGRDYKTGEAALADWNAGKDFVINNPLMRTYCSFLSKERKWRIYRPTLS